MKLENQVLDTIRKYSMLKDGTCVICGLSGGPDSVALCRILYALQPRLHLRLIAAHVNHSIRGASADEDEVFSRNLAKSLGIEFFSVRYDVPALAKQRGIGLEACARTVRYAYFTALADALGADCIATAHHADDALETALLHFARGTGIRGLTGIYPVRQLGSCLLIRPLVCISKQQIREYLAEVGADYRIDESNACDDYTRNRIRHYAIPALAQANAALIHTSIQTLKTLRTEADFLEEQTAQAYSRVVLNQSVAIAALLELHPALQGRVIEKFYLQAAGGQAAQLCAAHLDAVLSLCTSKHACAYVNLPAGLFARREYDRLFLEKNLRISQTPAPAALILGQSTEFGMWRITLMSVHAPVVEYKSVHNFFVDCSKIYGKLFVRSRLPGDKIHLAGHNSGSSLKKLMIDRKIPRPARQDWPVIADEYGVVAVAELGVDARVAIDTDSRELFFIQIEKC